MHVRSTRRKFAGTLLGIAGMGIPRRSGIDASADPDGSFGYGGKAQATPQLSIAMLDRHADLVQPLLDAFAESIRIRVDINRLGYQDLYDQINIALTQRSDRFDLVCIEDPWIPQFASFLAPIAASATMDVVAPVARVVSRYPDDSAPWAMPWLGDCQFFGFHERCLQQIDRRPPETWTETLDVVTALASEVADEEEWLSPFGMRSLDSHQLVESFLPILRGYGSDLIDPISGIPQLDTPAAIAAIDMFLALAGFSPTESPTPGDLDNSRRFQQGDICLMANTWSSDYLTAALDREGDNGVIPSTVAQPAEDGIDRKAMTGIWLVAVPAGSRKTGLARAVQSWFGSREHQATLISVGLPPVRFDVLKQTGMSSEIELPARMLEAATPRVRTPFHMQLAQLLGTELVRAVTGEISGAEATKNANIALRSFLVREGVLAE